MQNIKITLVWIPAHCNILYNEKADRLVKEATTIGTYLICFLHHSDFFEEIKRKFRYIQNKIITDQSQHKGNHYFMHYYQEKEKKPWFSKIDYPRFHLSTVNRVRANHYNLAASLFRKNMSDSPYCQCGHNTQDINHVLWDCPNLHNHRYSLKTTT